MTDFYSLFFFLHFVFFLSGESQRTLQEIDVPEFSGAHSYTEQTGVTRNRFIHWSVKNWFCRARFPRTKTLLQAWLDILFFLFLSGVVRRIPWNFVNRLSISTSLVRVFGCSSLLRCCPESLSGRRPHRLPSLSQRLRLFTFANSFIQDVSLPK